MQTLLENKKQFATLRPADVQEKSVENETHEQLPLSFAQQRLWFFSQLNPESSLYNVPLALRLTGVLDIPALQKSLDAIIERHEPLRTNFSSCGGNPVQIIRRHKKFAAKI